MSSPLEIDAGEARAWDAFVDVLGDHLAAEWPAMPERLGERWTGFVALAVERALGRGIVTAVGVARYVSLSIVWGPAFEERAGMEWAESLLAGGAADVVRAHQLVHRSMAELARRPDARVSAQTLAEADARLLDRFGMLGRRGALHPVEPQPPWPRRACDLGLVELRLLGDGAPHRVQLGSDGEWRREECAPVAPLRLDAGAAWPAWLHAPGRLDGEPPLALQLRVQPHAVCDGDHHPVAALAGPRGRVHARGHESKAFSTDIAARPPQAPHAAPGLRLAEETSPELYRVEFEACGLRDEGEPIAPLAGVRALPLSAWPRTQWWAEWQRSTPAPQSLLPGPRAWAPGATRARVEQDGRAADAEPLRAAFEHGLDGAVAGALGRLAAAWSQLEGLSRPTAVCSLGVLVGRFAATWGWQFAPTLDVAPRLRLVAQAAVEAVHAACSFGGELEHHGARSRVSLGLEGRVALAGEWRHEGFAEGPAEPQAQRQAQRQAQGAPSLAVLLLQRAQVRFSMPFVLQVDPVATEAAALLQAAAPVRGALVGEAGLRPVTRGASGWEWFATLRLEPVVAAFECVDPLLGRDRFERTLLPPGPLLDWSLG